MSTLSEMCRSGPQTWASAPGCQGYQEHAGQWFFFPQKAVFVPLSLQFLEISLSKVLGTMSAICPLNDEHLHLDASNINKKVILV